MQNQRLNLYFLYVSDLFSHLWDSSCLVRRRGYTSDKWSRWGSNNRSHSSCMVNLELPVSLLWTSLKYGRKAESLLREHRQTKKNKREAGTWNLQPCGYATQLTFVRSLSGLIDKPTGLMCAVACVALCSFIMHHVKHYWMWWTSGVISTSQGDI